MSSSEDFSSSKESFRRFEPQRVALQGPAAGSVARVRAPLALPFAKAFDILINYWEIKPSLYEARLQELALNDVSSVSAFVPWGHVETDIYHSLKKFLKAAHGARLKVKLYVMPELGLNYPSAGIPKEILETTACLAADRRGQAIYNLCAPNIFPLPSFFAPEVLKRFGNYLIKVSSILGEVASETHGADFIDIVISNSFFNYYRSPGLPPTDHGDYSASHVLAFRDFLDREYPGAAGEPFKRQVYEVHNRHRFLSYVERTLREKTEMIFSRVQSHTAVVNLDLLNPECTPDASTHALLCELYDFKPSVGLLYREICEGSHRGESVFLNGAGVFRRLSDQEKSFLVLASLIHTGEVAVGYDDVARFTEGFRRKMSKLLGVLRSKDYAVCRKMRFVAASKFGAAEAPLRRLRALAPGSMALAAGISPYTDSGAAYHERFVFIDPGYVLRQVDLLQAMTLAQAGKVVAIPAPLEKVANYLPEAAAHVEKFKKGKQPLRINLGVAYEVYDYQLGKVVFYDAAEFWGDHPPAAHKLDLFLKALLGLSDITAVCAINDQRLQVVTHVSRLDPGDKLLFLVNPTDEKITAKLTFEKPVALTGVPEVPGASAIMGQSFELEVPPLGVLSMALDENLSVQHQEQGPWN